MSLPQNQEKPWNPPAWIEELDAKIEEMAAELNEKERLGLSARLDRWAAQLVASVKDPAGQDSPCAAPADPSLVLSYPVPPRPESTGIPRAKPRRSTGSKRRFRGVYLNLSRDCADQLRAYARCSGVAFDTFLRFMVTRTLNQYQGQFGTGYWGLSHLTTAQRDNLKAIYRAVCWSGHVSEPQRN